MVLCMGAAAAAESPDDTNNVTMNSIDDAPIGVSEDAGGAEMLLGASNDENLLSAGSGSFKDLEDYINNNKGYGKTVYLNEDYVFNNETDSDYNVTGIYLGTYVTIDGQGHTIDAKNTRYIFNTIGKYITLQNINFKNTNYRAIEVGSSDVQIINCIFDNNTNRAVSLSDSALNSIIDDCTFINGQGIYSTATGAVIRNSIFKNNTATNGGAIQIANTENIIENCEFIENNAANGGAIFFKYDATYGKLYIENSIFNKNSANSGGAIYTENAIWYNNVKYVSKYNTVYIESSSFTENSATNYPELGGTELPDIWKTYVVDDATSQDFGKYSDEISQYFAGVNDVSEINIPNGYYIFNGTYIQWTIINNSNIVINGNGAIIDANGHKLLRIDSVSNGGSIVFNNFTFKNGFSTGDGGLFQIYSKSIVGHYKVTFNDCNFINSTSGRGGALFGAGPASSRFLQVIVDNCLFDSNTATTGGAVAISNARSSFSAYNTNFTNNKAIGSSGAVYDNGGQNGISSTSHKYSNCNFVNNTAGANYGGLYSRHGNQGRVTNTVFINNSACLYPASNAISSQEGNIQISSFADLVNDSADGYTEMPFNTYETSESVGLSNRMVVDGNGSTVIGQKQNLFTKKGYAWQYGNTVKNFILVNCSISNIATIENVTFINCTNPITMQYLTCLSSVKNVTFINCSGTLIDNLQNNILYDVTVDNVHYDNYELYDYFNGVNDGENIIFNATKDYTTLTSYYVNSLNTTIEGNNSKIEGIMGCKYIFYVCSNNTVIKNFTLKGSNTPINYITVPSGGNGVYANLPKNYLIENSIINVTFQDCTNGVNNPYNGSIIKCTFSNTASSALILSTVDGTNSSVIYCVFEDIKSSASGSGIKIGNGLVKNCTFNNITSLGNKGGAIYNSGSLNITESTFTNCAALSGAAIYQSDQNGVVNVSKSTFNGGVAKSAGGAIYVEGTLIIDDCDFNNNTADSSGAIDSYGPLSITNSSLTNNSAVLGGALSSDGDNPVISGCNVSGNKADVGAGISLSGDNARIDNVNFTDNTASVRGGALVTTGANTNVTNVNATGNSAPSGAAFVLDGDGAKLANSTIANNTGVNGGGSAVEVNGENIDILDNTVQGNDGSGVLVNGNGTNITGNHFNSTRDISINPNSDIYNNDTIMKKLQDENHPAGQVEILNDVDPTIIVSDVNVQQKTQFNITIQNPDFKGNVSVTLNGSVIFNGTFEDIKNNNSIIVGPVLPVAGEKTVTVFFYGDPKFNNKTVNTTFIVSRVTPQMNITIANVTYGNNSIVEVRIGNKANGTITITIDDIEITSIPIVDGNATCDLGVLPAGNKTANVQFRYNTSDYYNNNVGNFTSFCVDKAESVISIVVNGTYDIGEDVNITVSTTGSSGNLTFKINDKEYPVVNGTVNITGLPLDEYTITATLDADENYTNTEVTKTFTIKKINTDLILLKK